MEGRHSQAPRGGPVRQRFDCHLRTWPLPRLRHALQLILDAEIECKSTSYPDQAIARRLCMRLGSSARHVNGAERELPLQTDHSQTGT